MHISCCGCWLSHCKIMPLAHICVMRVCLWQNTSNPFPTKSDKSKINEHSKMTVFFKGHLILSLSRAISIILIIKSLKLWEQLEEFSNNSWNNFLFFPQTSSIPLFPQSTLPYFPLSSLPDHQKVHFFSPFTLVLMQTFSVWEKIDI